MADFEPGKSEADPAAKTGKEVLNDIIGDSLNVPRFCAQLLNLFNEPAFHFRAFCAT